MRSLWMLCQGLPEKCNNDSEGHICRRKQGFMRWMRDVCKRMPGQRNYIGSGARKSIEMGRRMKRNRKWYDYLWIFSLIYLILGFFNILFAWLGLLCFFIPLIIAVAKGNKAYCNKYCGRGQLFSLVGGRFGLSRKKDIPKWMKSKYFRYGFLVFFFLMFFLMLWNTYLVFAQAKGLSQVVTLLWTFKLPWHWAYHGTVFSDGVAQFAFGFYSVMLTSTVLGFLTMILFKPRSWCVYCPMGTMTQLICRARNSTR